MIICSWWTEVILSADVVSLVVYFPRQFGLVLLHSQPENYIFVGFFLQNERSEGDAAIYVATGTRGAAFK